MNDEDRMDYYSNFTVKQLKQMCKEKGAKSTGRKAELQERLVSYDRNKDFGYQTIIDLDESIITPSADLYKDINSDTLIPQITKKHIQAFLEEYSKSDDEAREMYNAGYLLYLRFCKTDKAFFAKGQCRASRDKGVKHEFNIELCMDGEISGHSCECTVGHSEEAHCKHIILGLMALVDMNENKKIILEELCTQQLQTFHHPKRRYQGSPMKAEKFKKRTPPVIPKDCVSEDNPEYVAMLNNRFKNAIINCGFNMDIPIKTILQPANPYAHYHDHGFYTNQDYLFINLLKSLYLINLSKEIVLEIELKTRNQSNSPIWHELRKHRITASNFHSVCHVSDEGAESLAQRLLHPVKLFNKPIKHGIIYEDVAVKKFANSNCDTLNIRKCGLFISYEKPHIAASPDRLLNDLSCIEVKCPYSIRVHKIDEKNCAYLYKDDEGNFQLKRNHPYFYQVQGQLYATKRQFCDFLVYTFEDLVRISISRDEKFIIDMIEKIDCFYVDHFLPALIKEYFIRDYDSVTCDCEKI